VLVATTADARAVHPFAEDRDARYAPAPLRAEAVAVPGGYRVDVRAESFARDVAILADRVAPVAEVDVQLVSLLAGEARSFTVRTAATVEPAAFADPLVLRCANSLVVERAEDRL
jgi:beta-mannosidase